MTKSKKKTKSATDTAFDQESSGSFNNTSQLDSLTNTNNSSISNSLNNSNTVNNSSTSSGQSGRGSFRGLESVVDRVEGDLLPGIDDFGEQYGKGEGLWTGSTLADQDQNVLGGERQSLRGGRKFQRGQNQVNKSLQGFLDFDPNSFQNQASRDALSANISAMFNESIQPGINDQGIASGQFGSPQNAIAMGAATAPLSRAMADAEVGLMNADRNRAMQAMGMSQGLLEGNFRQGQNLEDIGRDTTRREQLKLQDRIFGAEQDRGNSLRAIEDYNRNVVPLAELGSTSSGSENQQIRSTGEGQFQSPDTNYAQLGLGLGALYGQYSGGGGNTSDGVYEDTSNAEYF
jgi:hypothetical protein